MALHPDYLLPPVSRDEGEEMTECVVCGKELENVKTLNAVCSALCQQTYDATWDKFSVAVRGSGRSLTSIITLQHFRLARLEQRLRKMEERDGS
jgi:hypothetical protein